MKLKKILQEQEERRRLIQSRIDRSQGAMREYEEYITEQKELLEELNELIRILKENK